MKVGDRVTTAKVWKVENAVGTISTVAKDHIVVKWDEVKGSWYYTYEQAKELEVIDGSDCFAWRQISAGIRNYN